MLRPYTFLLSSFLLIEGVWGLFSPAVFGSLTTNTTHAVIHIVLGVIGLLTLASGNPRPYCILVGTLLLTVGAFYFLPGIGDMIFRLLNMNQTVAILNIVVGLLSLIAAGRERKMDRGGREKKSMDYN